jgi:two-component system phosphate regulon sensor histidine kinase PhoR
MKRLVESLLAIARIDTPDHQLDKKPVEIMALLRSVIATLENKATSHSITVHCMGDSVTLHADEVSLGQAFLNLVENAIHYGKPGGSVHIRVCEQNNRCEISFEDDGIGISQEDCGNVFQRFFRADPARSSHRGGFGLGLAFAKRVVELHGGAITVSSTLGQGSVFTLSIPK